MRFLANLVLELLFAACVVVLGCAVMVLGKEEE
jgi:hypothetical protein